MVAKSLVLARLASVATICAAAAVVVATSGAAPQQAAASSASLRPSAASMTGPARDAIIRSATTVASRAAVASPAVRSLPSVVTTPSELPTVALNAYVLAQQVIDSIKPGCHLSWTVLAAIGQIESDHGRSGGGHLQLDGTPSRPDRGSVLDGSGSSARVVDTDGGQLDGNSTWDRAVGPMQFLPSTWISVRVDGNGDGIRSPDDIGDASLAAAVFLCAWDDNLSTDTGAAHGIGRYNRSHGFTSAVLTLARAYESGTYGGSIAWHDVAASTWWPSLTSMSTPTLTPTPPEQATRPVQSGASGTSKSTHAEAMSTQGSEEVAVIPDSTGSPTPSPGTDSTPMAPSASIAPSSPVATEPPTGSATAGESPRATSSATPSATSSPTPSATPSATDGGAGSTTVTGTLEECGDQEFCIDAQALDLGLLTSPAAADYDGNGSIGDRQSELSGLLGTPVTVTVTGGTAAGTVVTLNAMPW